MTLYSRSVSRKALAALAICAALLSCFCASTFFASQAYAEGEEAGVVTYDLWIGGTQVTSENSTDVLEDGTISYDPDSATLILNGASITNEDSEHGAFVYADLKDLTVKCIKRSEVSGSETPRAKEPAFYSTGNITFKPEAKLWANTGIVAEGTVSVSNDTDADLVESTIETERIYSLHGNVVFNNASLYIHTFRNHWHSIYAGSSFIFNGGNVGINMNSLDGSDDGSAIFAVKSVTFNGEHLYCVNNGDGSVVDCGSSSGPGKITFGRNIKVRCDETGGDFGWVSTRKVGGNTYACLVWKEGSPTQEASIDYCVDEVVAIDDGNSGEQESHVQNSKSSSTSAKNGSHWRGGTWIATSLEESTEPLPLQAWMLLSFIRSAGAAVVNEPVQVELAANGGTIVVAKASSLDLDSVHGSE